MIARDILKMYLTLVLIISKGLMLVSTTESCPSIENAITIKDIQDAAYASTRIYDDNLAEGDTILGTQFRVTKLFNDELNEGGQGIRVSVADDNDTRIVVYRGTDGLEQLLKQGSSVLGREKQWIVDGVSTRVLTFFYDAYQLASYKLRPYLNDPAKKYILTGHSLGGALASILALDATQFLNGSVWKNPKSCLITFGQPRVGRSEYAIVHDRLISTFRKLRFVNKADPVPRIPPQLSGWRHHSRPVYIGLEGTFGRKRSIFPRHHHTTQHNRLTKRDEDHQQGLSRDFQLELEDLRKRFLWRTVYWKICGNSEDKKCTRNYPWNVPLVQYHFMQSYMDHVENPPQSFYTSNDILSTPFRRALVDCCQNTSSS